MNRIIKKAAALLLAAVMIVAVPNCTKLRTSDASGAVSAVWPVDKSYQNITTYFDPQRNVSDASGYHNAIDIEADYGVNVLAAYPGTCVSSSWMDAYGNMIILYHEDLGVYTFYAHCSSVEVYAGQAVSGGDLIGHVGSTGQSSGNHLHFGICDSLLSGWPCRTYYDPLSYFTYDSVAITNPNASPAGAAPACSCTDDCAGTYTTKGVTTFLNIREGHGSDTAAVGKIPAYAEFEVTKADGKWAHVVYGGVSGCVSMDYIQKIETAEPGMTVAGQTTPAASSEVGFAFDIKGVITSNLPIVKVWGGVYKKDGMSGVQTAEAAPNAKEYDLAGDFGSKIDFSKLDAGTYVYYIEAEDTSGEKFTIINSVFTLESADITAGDLNSDSKISISDAVLLQNYLLGAGTFTEQQFSAADLNGDKSVDTFDFIIMRQKLIESKTAE